MDAIVALAWATAGVSFLAAIGLLCFREGWPFVVAFCSSLAVAIVATLLDLLVPGLIVVTVIVTALVATWDSRRIRYSEYEGGHSPVIVLLGVLGLWILYFPWYLARRWRIAQGAVPRRATAQHGTPASR